MNKLFKFKFSNIIHRHIYKLKKKSYLSKTTVNITLISMILNVISKYTQQIIYLHEFIFLFFNTDQIDFVFKGKHKFT